MRCLFGAMAENKDGKAQNKTMVGTCHGCLMFTKSYGFFFILMKISDVVCRNRYGHACATFRVRRHSVFLDPKAMVIQKFGGGGGCTV